MQKNYVQEILSIIHSGLPKANWLKNCLITMKKIWRMRWRR